MSISFSSWPIGTRLVIGLLCGDILLHFFIRHFTDIHIGAFIECPGVDVSFFISDDQRDTGVYLMDISLQHQYHFPRVFAVRRFPEDLMVCSHNCIRSDNNAEILRQLFPA